MVFGTELSAGHHNEQFDFDENVMAIAVETLALAALNFPGSEVCNGGPLPLC
jgi:aminobenzoyl-glutamate utilization protein A